MERKEWELVAAKTAKQMSESYDRNSRVLPELSVGDCVRVQNQTTSRTTKWDKSGRVTKVLGNRQYEILMDGSRRVTMRNRRHLRRIPGKQVEQEEEGEEEDDDIQEDLRAPISPAASSPSSSSSSSSGSSPSSSSTGPTSPAKPAVSADQEPVPAQHNPVQPEQSDPDEEVDGPRRSGRSSNPPSRLEVTGNGKSYAAAVKTNFTSQQASVGGKRCGLSVPSLPKRRTEVRLGRLGDAVKP